MATAALDALVLSMWYNKDFSTYFFGCFRQVPKMFEINFVQNLRPQRIDPNEVSSSKLFDRSLIWIEDWQNNSQMIIKLMKNLQNQLI